jgi:hypothetical protein
MVKSRRLAWKVLLALVLVSTLPAILPQPAPAGNGPYGSALSLQVPGSAFAAAYCNDKYCAGGSRHNIVCAKVVGYHCQNLSGGYCTSNPC